MVASKQIGPDARAPGRRGDDRLLLALFAASLAAAGLAGILLASSAGVGPLCGPACLDRRLGELADAQGRLKPGAAGKARALIARELRFSPVDSAAWLRLAGLEAEAAGGWSPAAADALQASYRYAPVDAKVARWRLVFAFEHWPQLPTPLKAAAAAEIRGLLVSSANARVMRDLEGRIQNAAGRLAFGLIWRSAAGPG